MSLAHHKNRIKKYPVLLKRPKGSDSTGLFMRTSFFGKPFKYYLGVSILPELWDKVNYRPVVDRSVIKKAKRINPHIELELKNIELTIVKAENIIAEYILSVKRESKPFDISELKGLLDDGLKSVMQSDPVDEVNHFILDYIDDTIDGMLRGGIVINSCLLYTSPSPRDRG